MQQSLTIKLGRIVAAAVSSCVKGAGVTKLSRSIVFQKKILGLHGTVLRYSSKNEGIVYGALCV